MLKIISETLLFYNPFEDRIVLENETNQKNCTKIEEIESLVNLTSEELTNLKILNIRISLVKDININDIFPNLIELKIEQDKSPSISKNNINLSYDLLKRIEKLSLFQCKIKIIDLKRADDCLELPNLKNMESNYNRCINIKELICQNLEYIHCKSRKPFDTFLSIMIPNFEGTDDIFYNEENFKRIFKLFPKLIYYKLIYEKYHGNKLYYEATVRKFENNFIKFEIKKAKRENGFENYQKDIWCSKKRKKEILGNVEEIFINTRYIEQYLKKMFPSSYLF